MSKHPKAKRPKAVKVQSVRAWCGLATNGRLMLAQTCLGYSLSTAMANAYRSGLGVDRKFIPIRLVPIIKPKRKARKPRRSR